MKVSVPYFTAFGDSDTAAGLSDYDNGTHQIMDTRVVKSLYSLKTFNEF